MAALQMRIVMAMSVMLSASRALAGSSAYKYDQLGRLIKVCQTTAASCNIDAPGASDVVTAYTYDPAGNRTSHSITGSTNPTPPPSAVIIVPLNGFTIIPIE
jgi:hypothetical protein